jgi:ribosomal protein S18 acetylase RimI-like enzyme
MAVVPDSAPVVRRVAYPQDGPQMADLMEVGFGALLDPPSRAMLSGLRLWSGQGKLAWEFATAWGLVQVADWLDGFGAFEGERLLGNLSLARSAWGSGAWLIGNVAVLPECRRQGIARNLMQAALEEVRRRGGRRIVLQVDEDNDAALRLYQSFGFAQIARRSTWVHRTAGVAPQNSPTDISVRLRQDGDWRVEFDLIREQSPSGLAWNVPLSPARIRPSLGRKLGLFLMEESERHWLAWEGGRCVAVAISHATAREELALLVCRPESAARSTERLIDRLRGDATGLRDLTVEADSSIPMEVFEQQGYRLRRALIWLERYL